MPVRWRATSASQPASSLLATAVPRSRFGYAQAAASTLSLLAPPMVAQLSPVRAPANAAALATCDWISNNPAAGG
jgi:hypothetical protein